jgi:hypothetical protein
MSETIQATVVASGGPKPPELPPLPEAILLTNGRSSRHWAIAGKGSVASIKEYAAELSDYHCRIVQLHPPQAAKEVSDAEVVAIIRANHPFLTNSLQTDKEVMNGFGNTAACVRAALTKGLGT